MSPALRRWRSRRLTAGGHSYGGLPSLALVPLIVDAVAPSLVLAAGGIADGRGLAAALMLGADGDLLGVPGPSCEPGR